MSRRWNVNRRLRWARASARLASEPDDRSSTTSTSWPSASSRSTSVEPMKPAPPVTSTRTDQPAAADSSTRVADRAAPAGTRAPAADDRAVGDAWHARSTSASGPTIERSTIGTAHRRVRPSSSTAPVTTASLPTTLALAERRAATRAPRLDRGPAPRRHGAATLRIDGEPESRCTQIPGVDLLGVGHRREPERPANSVGVRLEVLLGRADVEPVVVGSASANRRPRCSSMRGNVSRSIETVRSAGMRSSTDGSST